MFEKISKKDSNLLIEKIVKNAKSVDDFIFELLQGKVKNLWDAGRHYFMGGGKRLRPFIVRRSYELCKLKKGEKEESFSDEKSIPIAASIEILHTFTLIHDDIMDQDDMRRNVPTVHVKWNTPIAILAGDLLYTEALRAVLNSQFDPEKKVGLINALVGVNEDLCEGQAMDMNFEERSDVSLDEYMEMIRLKTGALFRTSALFGAIASGGTSDEAAALELYGESMGIAFQIVDDILGLIADEKTLGKPIGSDIRASKKTFLLLYALEHLDNDAKKELSDIISKNLKSDEEITRATEIIIKSGALEEARMVAKRYIDKAIDALEHFPDSEVKQDLKMVALISAERAF